MPDIFTKLGEVGNLLDSHNLYGAANAIDRVSKSLFQIKQSQYAGFQGWAVRNGRCWGNCYRQKRATKPTLAAQEVWTECWEEYNDALKGTTKSWDKYADTENPSIKIASDDLQSFAQRVQTRLASGISVGHAIVSQIADDKNVHDRSIISLSEKLIVLAAKLSGKFPDLSEKVAAVNEELVKHAGWWNDMRSAWSANKNNRSIESEDKVLSQIEHQLQFAIRMAIRNNPVLGNTDHNTRRQTKIEQQNWADNWIAANSHKLDQVKNPAMALRANRLKDRNVIANYISSAAASMNPQPKSRPSNQNSQQGTPTPNLMADASQHIRQAALSILTDPANGKVNYPAKKDDLQRWLQAQLAHAYPAITVNLS